MAYDNEIIRILTEAGTDGLSVSKIVRHVYNASNTFFETVELEEVYRHVYTYLQRNSRSVDALIEKTERGIYRLNPNSQESSQLMLQFRDEEPQATPPVDKSLSLFW